jgi:hypothetical protein
MVQGHVMSPDEAVESFEAFSRVSVASRGVG